jgi:hypothetical protein
MKNINIFKIPEKEIKIIGESNYIYGFPTDIGLKKIANEISIIKNKYFNEDINGIDLGCGDGRLIDYFNKNIKNSSWIGIELSPTRIELSEYSDDNIIIEGDFLDLQYRDYNFIYANNVCYDEELSEKLEYKIFNEFSGYFIFSRKITNNNLFKMATLVKTFTANTNWNRNHEFYIYKL